MDSSGSSRSFCDAGFTVPEGNGKEAWLFEKGMGAERLTAIMKEAMAARAEGKTVLVAQMNKNKNSRRSSWEKKAIWSLKNFIRKN